MRRVGFWGELTGAAGSDLVVGGSVALQRRRAVRAIAARDRSDWDRAGLDGPALLSGTSIDGTEGNAFSNEARSGNAGCGQEEESIRCVHFDLVSVVTEETTVMSCSIPKKSDLEENFRRLVQKLQKRLSSKV
jgi:hypothetical protein